MSSFQKLCLNFEIQDAWCVCRFGSCVVDGDCWAGELCGDPECSNYTDCDCRWELDIVEAKIELVLNFLMAYTSLKK